MVKNIFLIRHADALLQNNDQRDFQRVLSSHGEKQSLLLGDYLRSNHVPIQAVFTSPAARTLATTKKIIDRLENPVKVIDVEEFYEATFNTMVASINRLEDMFQNVIIVGHNPSISQLGDYIVGEEISNFPTASCAWVELELENWSMLTKHSGILKDFYYPGKLAME